MPVIPQDLQGVRDISTATAAPFTPITDQVTPTLVNAAATAARSLYEGYKLDELTGKPSDPIPVVQGAILPVAPSGGGLPDLVRTQAGQDLNLNQILKLRKQGKASVDVARAMINTRIQALSETNPSMAAEYRQTAAQFFGDYGVGAKALNASEKESQQAQIALAFQKQCVASGVCDVNNPSDPVALTSFRETQRHLTNNAAIRDEILTNQSTSKLPVNAIVGIHTENAYASAVVDMNSILTDVATTGGVLDPAKAKVRVEASLTARHKQLQADLNTLQREGKYISPEESKAGHDAIDKAYSGMSKAIDDGSFQTYAKNQLELMRSSLALIGVKEYPRLAVLENAFPNIGSKVVDMMPSLMRMANDPQAIAAMEKNLPGMAEIVKSMRRDTPQTTLDFIEGIVNLRPGISPAHNDMMKGVALRMASTPPKEEGASDTSAVQAMRWLHQHGSPEYLFKAASTPALQRTLLESKGDNPQIARMRIDLQTQLRNTYNGQQSSGIPADFTNPDRRVDLVYKDGTYSMQWSPTFARGQINDPSQNFPKLREWIDKTNAAIKVMDIYGGHLEIRSGQDFADMVNKQLSDSREAVKFQQKAPDLTSDYYEKGRLYGNVYMPDGKYHDAMVVENATTGEKEFADLGLSSSQAGGPPFDITDLDKATIDRYHAANELRIKNKGK